MLRANLLQLKAHRRFLKLLRPTLSGGRRASGRGECAAGRNGGLVCGAVVTVLVSLCGAVVEMMVNVIIWWCWWRWQ
jgi:hypothetical protein